jgi:hypothetical protein
MLGSAHEGERATAALMASAILKTMGLTWAEVISRGLGAATSQQADQAHAAPNESQAASSDQDFSESWAHQARDGSSARKWRVRTRERNGVPAWKWVDELLKREGRLSDWDRQFLQCLRGLGKRARKDLALTTAQWGCVQSIAESIGWCPKG